MTPNCFFFKGALDKLMVETKDGRFQLNQLAQIAQKNPQMIVINLATSPQVSILFFVFR